MDNDQLEKEISKLMEATGNHTASMVTAISLMTQKGKTADEVINWMLGRGLPKDGMQKKNLSGYLNIGNKFVDKLR